MKRKRRHLTAEFKARVAAEALKGEKSILQFAQENDIAPTQVSTWKKELEDHMPSIFERKNAAPHTWNARSANSSSRKNSSKKSAISWESI
jgi:transposase-like protein